MRIAIVACPNGLGHLRRVISIAEFLYKSGFCGYIDLFAPPAQLKHLNSVWHESRCLMDRPHVKARWLDDLSVANLGIPGVDERIFSEVDFSGYDLVWSDNLLGILGQRPDAKITGSFFWHEVLEASGEKSPNITKWIQNCRDLLKNVKPQIAGVQYFASPEVLEQENFFPVGLYRYFGLVGKKSSRSVLLSCGLAGEEEENVRDAIDVILEKEMKPPDCLYVEPRLLPKYYPDWVIPANFSGDMFHRIMASCIRPGLGTISDSLISHNKIFSFSKPGSYEMDFNAKVLEKMNLGKHHNCALQAYKNALKFILNEDEIESQINKTLHLRTDGVMATAEFIAS